MNIFYLNKKNERKLAHTVNGTALAVPRILMALLENTYDPLSKTMAIPEVLQPYVGHDTLPNPHLNKKNIIFSST